MNRRDDEPAAPRRPQPWPTWLVLGLLVVLVPLVFALAAGVTRWLVGGPPLAFWRSGP